MGSILEARQAGSHAAAKATICLNIESEAEKTRQRRR